MKKILLAVCIIMIAAMNMVGCRDNKGADKKPKARSAAKAKAKKPLFTPTSAGGPYEVLVVYEPNDLLTGAFDTLYNVLTDDVLGLSQAEPSFDVMKISSNNFSKNLHLCRNIIIMNIDSRLYTQCKFKYTKNVYAYPQIVMNIQAPNAEEFKRFVKTNHDVIINFFTRAELNHEAEHLKEQYNPMVREKVMNMFGCDIFSLPELNKTKTGRNFLWFSTDRVNKDMNFVIYSYPYRDKRTFTKDYFIRKRDSVMKANVPGPREGQYMMTTPFVMFNDDEVHGAYAQVVRGLWNIRNYDMGGPFVSVARVDEKNQRVIVVEGFVYSPATDKRNLIRRLEASLYTLRLPEELDLARNTFDLDEIEINPE